MIILAMNITDLNNTGKVIIMKKIMLIVSALMVFLFTHICSAMTISQPEHLGDVIGANIGGFGFKGELSNSGNIINKKRAYDKGVAVFGKGNKKLYVHYQNYGYSGKNSPQISKYGSNSSDNAIQITTLYNQIFMLNTNENITMYVIKSDYDLPGEENYILIGERQDGRFVRYLDTDTLLSQYYSDSNRVLHYVTNFYTQGNTLVFKYSIWDWDNINGKRKDKKDVGEIRCKWDDKAQWFGVENVVY